MAEEEAPAVGIDLGTTYSRVSIWKNGKVEIVVNERGSRTTPSCVAFNDRERLIGEGAADQAVKNHANTVYDAKRLIGRRFSDEIVQNDLKIWPFQVVAGDNDKPTIAVRYKGEEERFTPEEISAMFLSKMKEIASTFLGRPVRKAVVTVPAYFNNSQRQSTKDAGEIVGLDIIHILNEPTAAALAYGLENKDICSCGGRKKFLIFDLGGGTFDVSLLELDEHGVVEVKATNGDTHLGGQDFDNRMVDHLVEVFKMKHQKDISENKKCKRRLEMECEKAKRALSRSMMTNINIESLFDGIDFSVTFSRVKFEELNKELFDRCLGTLEQCLKDAGVDKKDVDEVVLVGGSTRIPRLHELLKDFFNRKKLNHRINAAEAVAIGAAIQAASLHTGIGPVAPDVVLQDVAPLSLGLKDYEGLMRVIIPRNTRIPCEIEQEWQTSRDCQWATAFQIYEGEKPMAVDNNPLGEFVLSGPRPALKDEIKFLVVFKIDENDILHVSAKNEDSGEKADITITRDKLTTLSKEEISGMISNAKRLDSDDSERKRTEFARHELEDYANKIRDFVLGNKILLTMLTNDLRQKFESAIDTVIEWLEEDDDVPCYEFEQRKDALEKVWEPIMAKYGVRNQNA